MNVLDAIRGRRAVRAYSGEPVNKNLLSGLVDAAVTAPNAMNRQPWLFAAVTDRAQLKRISDAAKAHTLANLAATPGLEQYSAQLSDPEFDIFYGAPALMLICATAPDEMATIDCCLAAENFMLAAHADGLGTCWIGFAQAWLQSPDGVAELNLPEGARVVAPIVIGRPRGKPDAPPRQRARIQWIRPEPAAAN